MDAQLDRIVSATAPLHGALPAIREFLTTGSQTAGQLTAVRGEVRGSRRSILAVLAGGLLVLGRLGLASLRLGWWVKKDAALTGQTVSRVEEKVDTQQQTAARTEEKVDVLLAVMRDLPGTLGKQGSLQNPQDEAARLATAYAELEKKHGLGRVHTN